MPQKYGAILCDPPWRFLSWDRQVGPRSVEKKYRTAPTQDLATLPVLDIAAPQAALFMWTVDSHLDQAIGLMRSWGFDYRTIAFVWVKTGPVGERCPSCAVQPMAPRMGMGLWTRKEMEICLLGTRGKPKRLSGGVRQVIMEPRREHSRKPDETYRRVEQLVGGPFVELFARQRWLGWDVAFSDEADKFAAAA